jgi:hypothetical protein
VDDSGFDLRLQAEQAGDGHGTETVGWIAVEAGVGNGVEAGLTEWEVDHRADEFDFAGPRAAAPVLLADMQTVNGGDPAELRLTRHDSNGFGVFVQEEQSGDEETWHLPEEIGYAAFEQGLLFVEEAPLVA